MLKALLSYLEDRQNALRAADRLKNVTTRTSLDEIGRTSMAWLIEFSDEADRDFAKLDKMIQCRVFRYLHERIANAQDARDFGKSLQHELSGQWRYRVGDYGIPCQIEDELLTVLVVEIVHRSAAYD